MYLCGCAERFCVLMFCRCLYMNVGMNLLVNKSWWVCEWVSETVNVWECTWASVIVWLCSKSFCVFVYMNAWVNLLVNESKWVSECFKLTENDMFNWISVLVFVYVNEQWRCLNLSVRMLIMEEFKLRVWFCGKVLNFYV